MAGKSLSYISTRGEGMGISSAEAIVKGIAPDGGLYVPSMIPPLGRSLSGLTVLNYKDLCFFILGKFLTDYSDDELRNCIENAYDEKFDTPEIAPLVKTGKLFFLELYHGATAAFKDMALSILPYLLTAAVKKLGIEKEIVILTATSGDTGKAALESFSNVEGTRIIVFFPGKGVSPVQERQMTTQEGKNTYVCSIEGNFDDAQNAVKAIFNDKSFNEEIKKKGFMFSSANSINIGRLLPQVVYYVHSYLRLLERDEIAEGEKINIVVPTGNFGNILAAYYAKKMGLPVKNFICASNINNVLFDFISTGIYNRSRELKLTVSPSMDILISSNLERLVYDLSCSNPETVKNFYRVLASDGRFAIGSEMKEKLDDFIAGFASDRETISAISEVYGNYGYLMDTHTAVGYHVYKKYLSETGDRTRTIIASTASPFKFPASVMKAIGDRTSAREGLSEFELLDRLSVISGLEIPRSLKGIGNRKIIHKNHCGKDDIRDFVEKALGF